MWHADPYLGLPVFHQLDPKHEPLASHIPNDAVLLLQCLQTLLDVATNLWQTQTVGKTGSRLELCSQPGRFLSPMGTNRCQGLEFGVSPKSNRSQPTINMAYMQTHVIVLPL